MKIVTREILENNINLRDSMYCLRVIVDNEGLFLSEINDDILKKLYTKVRNNVNEKIGNYSFDSFKTDLTESIARVALSTYEGETNE